MDLEKELQYRQHKQFVQRLANNIVKNEALLPLFFDLLMYGQDPIPQHAGWVLHHVSDLEPETIIPFIADLIERLENPAHDAVKRGVIRALVPIEIPEEQLGQVADICFRFLEDINETIAVKVHSMTVLWKICRVFPELSNELIMQIENQLPTGSAGFKNRGQKIIQALRTGSDKLR